MNGQQAEQHFKIPIFDTFPGLIAAQSTRLGGNSQAPYAHQNLGLYTKDDPEVIRENRHAFFKSLGFVEAQVAGARQVHGDDVALVSRPGQYEDYDALITNQENILLTVTTADCTPILLFAPDQRVCAAVHAGWRGTIAKILLKTASIMKQHYGVKLQDCFAYIGPCIDECSFEVNADVADYFDPVFKRWDEVKRKFFIDLKQANRAQLLTAGLSPKNIEISPFSTYTHNDLFFSYRKEKGKTGRMLTVIGLQA